MAKASRGWNSGEEDHLLLLWYSWVRTKRDLTFRSEVAELNVCSLLWRDGWNLMHSEWCLLILMVQWMDHGTNKVHDFRWISWWDEWAMIKVKECSLTTSCDGRDGPCYKVNDFRWVFWWAHVTKWMISADYSDGMDGPWYILVVSDGFRSIWWDGWTMIEWERGSLNIIMG